MRNNRYIVESEEKWRDHINDMDYFNLREGYYLKIIPPFGGALMRFHIKFKEDEFSIYYDTQDALGYAGQPYYELHPDEDDGCFRAFCVNDILMKIYLLCEGDIIKGIYPEYFL